MCNSNEKFKLQIDKTHSHTHMYAYTGCNRKIELAKYLDKYSLDLKYVFNVFLKVICRYENLRQSALLRG